MKRILPVVFVFFAVASFAQTPELPTSGILRMGLTLSPDICYRTLSTESPTSQVIIDTRNEIEVPMLGFTAGFGVIFQLHRRLALETGLKLSNNSQKRKTVLLTDLSGETLGEGRTTDRRYYFDIPVQINYSLIDKRVGLFISAGLSPGLYLSSGMTTRADFIDGSSGVTKTRGRESGVSVFNVAAIGGIGLDLDITDHLELRAGPVFRYSLLPLFPDVSINQYNYSLGGSLGLFYEL